VALLFGVGAGALAGPRPGRARLALTLAVCVALGAGAAWLNGELADEPWLIVFDAAQVMAAAGMTIVVLRLFARRAATRSAG
jgi:hypothetical protein